MKLLTFREWLLEYFPHFIIDNSNKEIIKKFGMWAWRSDKFNNPAVGHHIDKGLILHGTVGAGKTDLMRMLSKYETYLQSPYRFGTDIVWEFGPAYREKGFHAFNGIKTGNWFFDELALTNQQGEPYLELINDFGNKILIGEQLILMRYNIFKRNGLQTHFTTNLGPDQLKKIYGQRCFSRLYEMGNFISYTGDDRRFDVTPTFYINQNNYLPQDPEIPTDQITMECKESLNAKYLEYVSTGNAKTINGTEFELLKSLGHVTSDDIELREIKLDIELLRIEQINLPAVNIPEARRFKQLKVQYEKKELDAEETSLIWIRTKKESVQRFFERLKAEHKEKIFEL